MVNKVILLGNTGAAPEVKVLEGGKKVAHISLATTETYKNRNGEKVSSTEWHNITLWEGLAEIAEKYLKKGSQIYLEGKLHYSSWDDQGTKRYSTEIVAESIRMISTPEQPSGYSPY